MAKKKTSMQVPVVASKPRKRSPVQRRKRRGLIQRATPFRVYVDGGVKQYRRLRDLILWHRTLAKRMLSCISSAQAATAELSVHKKSGRLIMIGNNERANAVLALLFGPLGKMKYYELRGLYMQAAAKLLAAGGPHYGSHMWDGLREQLGAVRDKEMPDYNGLPRGKLELSGLLDVPLCRRLPMPIMRTCGRHYVHAIEDERGKRFRIQVGRKEDVFDLIVEGTVELDKGEFVKKLNAGQRRDFHKFATGAWEYQTPTINLSSDGKLTLNVPYSRPMKVISDTQKENVMEVCFKTIKGSELPRQRHDRGTDDDKIFVVHCFKRGSSQQLHIPVNDVLADMRRYAAKKNALENQRDCRRRWPSRLRKPLVERIKRQTKLRLRRQRDANHVWARQIIRMAGFWCCGTIKVFGLPNGVTEGLLMDQSVPWQWSEFMRFLGDKAEEAKMVVRQIVRSNLVETLRKKVG